MTTSIPLAAKSLRVGMTVLAYSERNPFVLRKITPIKDGKRVRLFWKDSKFTYWDVYLESLVPVVTNEHGRVTFDREVMGEQPKFDVSTENGVVTAAWVNTDESAQPDVSTAAVAVPFESHEKCQERETNLECQLDDANREISDLNSRVSLLNGLLENEERMVSALQKLVLTKFTKEELLSMALGRQSD